MMALPKPWFRRKHRRRYRVTYRRPQRSKGVWFALAAGVVAVVASALLILAPSVGIVSAAIGVRPFLRIPIGTTVLVVILGYGVAIGMIALTLRARHAWTAWLYAFIGAVAAGGASVYPLIATAIAVAGDVGGILPAVKELLAFAGSLL